MTDEKPTGDAGASISERLEAVIAREDEGQQSDAGQAAPERQAPEVEAPESDAPDEVDGPQFELSHVAQVLGLDEAMLDVDEDGSLKIKTKIDGQESAAKLQDLIKSYQLQGHVDQKVRHVAEKEKAVDERASQYEHFAQSKLQELNSLTQAAHHMMAQEFAAVDWDRLLAEDPLGYQTKRHAFEKQSGKAQQLLQAFNQQSQEIAQALQFKQTQEFEREIHRLPAMVPEWKDFKSIETGLTNVAKWLHSKGANVQRGLSDAVTLATLHRAMQAEQKAPKVEATEKKVRSAPKLVRPGQGTDANQRGSDAVRGAKDQLRKSGGKSGFAEYLLATGKV